MRVAAPTAPPTRRSDIDTTISYEARDIINLVKEKRSMFIGDAVVKYKNITLQAGKITIDWDDHLMIAEPLVDSVWVKSDDGDSVLVPKRVGEPVLIEAGSQMTGAKMIYNYKTEKGRVVRGRTELEGGKYVGRQIKKIDDKTLFVSNSIFTTCDLDSNPHFHFEARRLKMITNDKVIAKPVVFYIGKIPVAMLPFALFPHRKGRQSGIIMPRYGESVREGRYLRELGYYWAPNDYFDARFLVDFFEKTGWLFRSGANYNVRYKMNGRVSGSWTRKTTLGDVKIRRWDLRFRHNQEIDPTSRFSASGYFVSDKNYYRDLSTNLSTRLTRELRSNATYSKRWPKHKLSLSVNLNRVHDLEDNTTSQTFPQLTFRKGQSQLFAPGKAKRSRGRRRRRPQPKWYHSLYYSYSSSLLNARKEFLVKGEEDTTKNVTVTRHLNHNLNFSLNSPKKYFGWLSLNQSLAVREAWFDETRAFSLDAEKNEIVEEKVKGFAARHTFSYNATANTKLYGLFAPGIADIQAIRHVVTPSFSFQYMPDFSDPKWGYWVKVKDTTGQVLKKDRFGGTPSGGRQFISMSVRNLFQMKKGYGEKEKKIDLFTMDFRTGYNFKADQYRLSNLTTSWQANPARNFSLSAGTTHSFYQWDIEEKSTVNRYLFEGDGWKHGRFMRLTNFRINFSIRLQGRGGQKGRRSEDALEQRPEDEEFPPEEEADVLEEDVLREGNRFEAERSFQSLSIPWRVAFNFNFTLDKSNPEKPVKRYYLDIRGAQVNLTKNWRISYNAHFDLAKRIITYHRFTFYRDLHCWEAQVDWVPSGINKRVYFRINVKASALRDIKLERRGGRAGMLGY